MAMRQKVRRCEDNEKLKTGGCGKQLGETSADQASGKANGLEDRGSNQV